MSSNPRVAIGIDLAWGETAASGLARWVEEPDDDGNGVAGWRLGELRTARSMSAILAWLDQAVRDPDRTWIAVDAPLLATNEAGTQRAADRTWSDDLRRFRSPLLPVAAPDAVRGAQLREHLAQSHGIPYRPPAAAASGGVFETFPTAAQLGLLDLHRPIRYKHGDVASRKAAFRQLQLRLALLDDAALPIRGGVWERLLREDPAMLRGAALKDLEDRVDAALCGLVAILAWTAPMRLRTEGSRDDGFLTIPHLPVH